MIKVCVLSIFDFAHRNDRKSRIVGQSSGRQSCSVLSAGCPQPLTQMQTSHSEQPFDDSKNVAFRIVMCMSIFFRLRSRLVFNSVDLLFDHLLDLMIGEVFLVFLSVVAHKPMNLMYDKCSRDSHWRLGHTTHETGLCTHFYLPESDSRRMLSRQKSDIQMFICPIPA